MMQTRAVVVKKDENGKRVYELRESVGGSSENIQNNKKLKSCPNIIGT